MNDTIRGSFAIVAFCSDFHGTTKGGVTPDFDIALQHKASHIAAALRTDLIIRAFRKGAWP